MKKLIVIVLQAVLLNSLSFGQFHDFPERFNPVKNKIASVFSYEKTKDQDTTNRIKRNYNREGQLIHYETDFFDVHSGVNYLLTDYTYNQNGFIVKEIVMSRHDTSSYITQYEYKDSLLQLKKTNSGCFWSYTYDSKNRLTSESFYIDSSRLIQGHFFSFDGNAKFEKVLTEDLFISYTTCYYSKNKELLQELQFDWDSTLIGRTDYIYEDKKIAEKIYYQYDTLFSTTKYFYYPNDSLSSEIELDNKNKVTSVKDFKYDKAGKLYEENFFSDRYDFSRQLYYNAKGDIEKQLFFYKDRQTMERRYEYTYWE